jgi:DNA-binding LacI/PurR family transcriptional regulator
MAVTQRDVAARAGVTKIVVSHVLHNRASTVRVSEATAERVRQAAEELGYKCNVWARNFRKQQTNTIGVLHGVGFSRPRFDSGSRYFAALMDGIIDGAFEHGYSVTLCPQLLGEKPLEAISDGRFDGLVWYSNSPSDVSRKILSDADVPLVVIHTPVKELDDLHPCVLCDNDHGIGLAVEHLVMLGHKDIAYALDVHPINSEAMERRDAFIKHMARFGLPRTQNDVLALQFASNGVGEYLKSPRHTAIIAYHDGLAAEFIARAPEYGLIVPRDLSIVGFDSTAFCRELRPALTSIYQPLTAMGRKAIDLLVPVIRGEAGRMEESILPCRLDIRESTAPPSR